MPEEYFVITHMHTFKTYTRMMLGDARNVWYILLTEW